MGGGPAFVVIIFTLMGDKLGLQGGGQSMVGGEGDGAFFEVIK